ncbi:MAG TPA: FliH/SctL family protein, partial [Solirubrobacteraceae bacterium]|nr:FliH/SctL family protein [Solirubrobacteraceae bacterium]
MASACASLRQAVTELETMRSELAGDVERDAVDLAITLAGKVIAGALQARPELVVEVVQGALRRVAGQRTVRVLLNPGDLPTVEAALGELGTPGNETCELLPDQRVTPGSAVVRTADGEVDASVQAQLERAREVAFEEMGGAGP